jgi:hypothetical protein
MLAFVGVMSSTSVRTLRAGRTVVAPNGDINADMDTRKMIQVFILELNTEYGGPETCRCNVSRGPFFSRSNSWDTFVFLSESLLSSDNDIALEFVIVSVVHGKKNGRATYGEKRS